ncbi:MAG: PhnD/SsuA/transferrin family substrate-binding protein [bacterium]|nr:PhnD/SsuA/transferrin family substrate-binding protein [bacterium]
MPGKLRLILLIASLMILAGCGGDTAPETVATLTPVPTLTQQERVAFAPGLPQNPLQLVVVPLRRADETSTALLESALYERTGIYFEVIQVESSARALTALCNSGEGIVSIVWLDGVTTAAARAQNCGQPALLVASVPVSRPLITGAPEATPEATIEAPELPTDEPSQAETPEATSEETAEALNEEATTEPVETAVEEESTPEATPVATTAENLQIGTAGLILLNEDFGGLTSLRGEVFCRLSETDFFTWFVPALVMQQGGLDPQRDVTVREEDSLEALVQAVSDGDCAATGLSQDAYDTLFAEQPDLFENVEIAATTPAFPYGLLLYPLEIDLGVRLTLNEQLPLLAQDETVGAVLRGLLGQTALLPVEDETLADFDAFLTATGFDFAQLGN